MEIKILGTGCSSCRALFETVKRVVSDTGIQASVAKVEDLLQIMSYNVLSLPALVIDGQVVAKGSMTEEQVRAVLSSQCGKEGRQ